jgi:general secretion pathway protein G
VTPIQVFTAFRSRHGGFTLLELLVVLVIMGLLTTVVAPQVMNMFSGAKSDTAALQVETITTALNYYRIDTGAYPDMEHGLEALWKAPADIPKWRGPYVRKRQHLVDPWGRPYRYRLPGKHGQVDVFTLGADDSEGGEGENRDVGNWDGG